MSFSPPVDLDSFVEIEYRTVVMLTLDSLLVLYEQSVGELSGLPATPPTWVNTLDGRRSLTKKNPARNDFSLCVFSPLVLGQSTSVS